MKNKLLLLVLTFGLLAALVFPAVPVTALGPSDNSTVPGSPASDQPQNEIKPPVEYVLLEPTSQTESESPHLIARVITSSGREETVVFGNENWYLDLDINVPGWIYIYEAPGHWLAYKWQLPESGLWRLGPFRPGDNEADGKHMYWLGFYGNDQWAAVNSSPSHTIYFTYSPHKPVEPPATPPPEEEPEFADKLYEFFSRPLVLGVSLSLVVIMLALVLIFTWRRRSRLSIKGEAPAASSDTLPLTPARAKIALPDGTFLRLSGADRMIGRADLARALSLDDLTLISRKHFQVKADDEHFYIEDISSSNGTLLNGNNISGKGPLELSDGDLIEPASAVSLEFHLL
jgi:hypothetical protein